MSQTSCLPAIRLTHLLGRVQPQVSGLTLRRTPSVGTQLPRHTAAAPASSHHWPPMADPCCRPSQMPQRGNHHQGERAHADTWRAAAEISPSSVTVTGFARTSGWRWQTGIGSWIAARQPSQQPACSARQHRLLRRFKGPLSHARRCRLADYRQGLHIGNIREPRRTCAVC